MIPSCVTIQTCCCKDSTAEILAASCYTLVTSFEQLKTVNTAGIGGILVSSTITLTEPIDINIPIYISPCGSILTNNFSITFNDSFIAGTYKCITSFIGGVVFGLNSVERVLPQWFGAVGDGVTNCSLAINIAFASLKDFGGMVFLPSGTYYILTSLIGYSNVSFFGTGDSSIIKSGFSLLQNRSLLELIGTETTSTTLTANTAIGDRTIQVTSSSQFSVGSYVYIIQSDNWAELHRIKSIDNPTQITFHELVGFQWNIGDILLNGNWVNNVTVKNIRFIGTEVSDEHANSRFEDHAVNCQRAHHIVVAECSFLNIGSRAIIFIDKCSECIADNNRVVRTYDRGIESHHKTNGNILSNNVIEGGLIGIAVHGIGTVASGNSCYGQYGYDSGNTLRGSGLVAGDAKGCTISNNTIHGSQREGMAIGSNVEDTVISGNTIAYSKRDGMTVYGNWLNICNNHFYQNGTVVEDACISFVHENSFNFINGNYFHARLDSSVTTRAIASTFDQSFLCIGVNQFVNFPGGLTNLTAGTTYTPTHIGQSVEGLREVLAASTTWNPPSIANGAYAFKDLAVPDCAFGDKCTTGFTVLLPDGAFMQANILSAGNVRVSLYNFTGGAIDIGSGTLSVQAWRDRFGIGGNNG